LICISCFIAELAVIAFITDIANNGTP